MPRFLDQLERSEQSQEKASQASNHMLISMREMAAQDQAVNSAKEKGEKTWCRLPPSQKKQWHTFKVLDVKRRRKVSLAPIIDAGGI